MSTINTRIVRRSVGLLEEIIPSRHAELYAIDFSYQERMLAPDEPTAAKISRAALAPAAKRAELVEKGRLPKPGEGPDAAERAQSWFRYDLIAEADGPAGASGSLSFKLAGSVSGGDPGYDETAKMVSETAVALATHTREERAEANIHAKISRRRSGTPKECSDPELVALHKRMQELSAGLGGGGAVGGGGVKAGWPNSSGVSLAGPTSSSSRHSRSSSTRKQQQSTQHASWASGFASYAESLLPAAPPRSQFEWVVENPLMMHRASDEDRQLQRRLSMLNSLQQETIKLEKKMRAEVSP